MVVIWSEEATADLQDIFDGISDESAQNALLVDERICKQTDSLAQFPSLGRSSVIDGIRELVIDRTPYLAMYRIEEHCIRIVRIVHGSQTRPPIM